MAPVRQRAVAEERMLPSISLLAACAFAVCLGLVLAIVLPSAAALSAPWGERWRALVQVHGQAMVLGFAGLFILGMGARLLPRFSGAPLYRPRLLNAAFVLITAAVVGRSIAQPLSNAAWARALLFASGLLECAGAAAFAVLQAGAAGLVVAAVAGGGTGGWWQVSAAARVVLALVAATACMGVWHPASRLRDNSRTIGLLLRGAYGWMLAAAVLLLYGAWEGWRTGQLAPDYLDDATRPVLAIGVVATMIVGMAYLAGHMFAAERTSGAMRRRLRGYHVLLSSAAFLRAGGALLEGHDAPLWRFWLMSGAGVLVIVAIAWFATRIISGLRHPYEPPVVITVR